MVRIRRVIDSILEEKISLLAWAGGFLGMVLIRCFIEQFLAGSPPLLVSERVVEFVHNLFFFLLSILMLWIFLSWILKVNPLKLSGVFFRASFLMILPPVIDMLKTGGEVFWSFYLLSNIKDLKIQFLTVFGHLPSGIVYFGTKITFILAIFLVGFLVRALTKNWVKTIISAVGSYVILFFMGSFPTIFFFGYNFFFGTQKFTQIQGFNVAQFFGNPQSFFGVSPPSIKYAFSFKLDLVYFIFLVFLLFVLFYLSNRKKLWAILKNFRYPQVIYHSGLFLVGVGLGSLAYPENFRLNLFSIASLLVLLISVWLAWKASVVVNDINDFEIDKISNPERPLPRGIFSQEEYANFGAICFLLSLLGALVLGLSFFVLLLLYQILAWFYSAHPIRLKKFPGIATFTSALASLLILFLGYILISPEQTIQGLSWRIPLLLLVTYTISLPIKDLKDIAGDKQDEVWTIPVILGEKRGRLFIAASLLISFMLSVFFLNELRLFWWALIFGISSFLVVNSLGLNPRKVFWPVLGLAAVYGLILVKLVFID